ncbi:MAG: type II toxin-antitoxin system RelE/ParE family toxin [Pseudomonadota bacterium]
MRASLSRLKRLPQSSHAFERYELSADAVSTAGPFEHRRLPRCRVSANCPRVELIFRRTFELLGDFPTIGRPGPRTDTRELPVRQYPYVIIYRMNAERVDILRIYHMARDPEAKLPDD